MDTDAKTASDRWALAALSLCVLLPSLAVSSANVALPALAEAFHAPFEDVQHVVLAYLVAHTAFTVAAGRLGDAFGRRRILLAGILAFAAASLACAAASSLWILDASRVIQGLGAAAMLALAMAMATDAAKQRMGSAMGLLGTTSAIGTALGPMLGGFLVAVAGWRAIFLMNVPLALLAAALVMRELPPDPVARATGRKSDASGSAASGKTAALAMTMLVSAVMMATLIAGPFHLARALGLDAASVGLAMSAGPIAAALAGIPAGRLVDRHGVRATTLVGLGGMALGCAGLAVAPNAWGAAGYVMPLVVLTIHYAVFQSANNTGVMKDVAAEGRGAMSGMLNLARNTGLIVGASAMGALFSAAGMAVTFGIASAMLAASLLISAWSRAARERRFA